MLPKFSILPPKPQYQTVDDVSSKASIRLDESMNSTLSTDDRDDSMCEIISTAGKQFSVTSAESRQGVDKDKEVTHPTSPVDCHDFPEVEFHTAHWLPPPPPRKSHKTLVQTKDTVQNATLPDEGFEAEWPGYGLPPHSPASAFKNLHEAETIATMDITSSEHTSFEVKSPNRDYSFFVATPNTSAVTRGDTSFVESVGNVTMDAFGFPLVEPSTPRVNKSMRTVPLCPRDSPAKLIRSVRSDPALNRLTLRSYVEARNGDAVHSVVPLKPELLARAHLQARYKKTDPSKANDNESANEVSAPSDVPFEAEQSPLESTPNKLNPSEADQPTVESVPDKLNPSEAKQTPSESIPNKLNPSEADQPPLESIPNKLDNAISLLSKAKSIVTDDDVDNMLTMIEDPNKSCEEEATLPDVSPKVPHDGSHRLIIMPPDGSFDAQESTIEVLDSSGEAPQTQGTKHKPRRQRVPRSKLRCTDEAMQCNINFQEMEKAMWAFMDEFDERAGKFGYIVGCIERVPREVNMSVNEMSFSLLEDDEHIIGSKQSVLEDDENNIGSKQNVDPSVSMLDSLTLDD